MNIVVVLVSSMLSVCAMASDTLVPPKKVSAGSTFCNPVNIEYCFTPYGWQGREAADPMVALFKGEYYLFASKSGGYWWSKDMITWNLVPIDENYRYEGDSRVSDGPETALPVWSYNPSAFVLNGELYYSQQLDAFYRLLDPKKATFEKVRERLPVENDHWVFVDDDGKVYVYAIGFDPRGAYVFELDSRENIKVLRGPEKCMPVGDFQPAVSGNFSVGPVTDPTAQIARHTGEGCQMTKRKGLYYLQISFSGTDDPIYRDCAFVSASPWGPFAFMANNPVSYRPTGFCTGARNTGVFADKRGDDWRAVTTCVCVNHIFERRVSIYPAGVDRDNEMFTDTYLGDLPQFGPGHRRKGPGGNLVGWMLLSYRKEATSSSTIDSHPSVACDENIKTLWSAKTGEKGEWLAIDLGKQCRINAVQINFADQDTTAVKRHEKDELYYQYVLEVSEDGQKWKMIADKSANKRDDPHDYIQLEKPVMARHVKLTNIRMAARGKFAVRDLRVFGSGLGKLPAEVKDAVVRRENKDVKARVEWPAADGATGYVVRWGSSKDKLYHSQDVRE